MVYTELEHNYTQMFRRMFLAWSEYIYMYETTDSQTTIDGVPVRKLFVSNLARRSTFKDLQKCFSTYGNIESCYLRRNDKKSSYAFVTFYTVEDANRALKDGMCKQIRLHNKDLKVLPADSWHQPDSREKQLHNLEEIHMETEEIPGALRGDAVTFVFRYLTFKERLRLEQVCKIWRNISLARGTWSDVKKLSLTSKQWRDVHIHSLRTSSLRQILLRCGSDLKELDLSYQIHGLGLSTVSVIAKLCPRLESLDLSGLTVTSSSLDMLAHRCKGLVKLVLGITLSNCEAELTNIIENTHLKYIALKRTNIIGRCLTRLGSETTTLIVDRCDDLKDIYFAITLRQLKLTHLTIRSCPSLQNKTLEAIISYCTSLKSLELDSVFGILKDEILLELLPVNLLKLTTLTVTCINLSSAFFDLLVTNCTNLASVTIIGCIEMKNNHIDHFSRSKSLETLILNTLNQITDDALLNIHDLKHFECRKCERITSTGIISVIAGSPKLEVLDVSGCRSVKSDILEAANHLCINRNDNTKLSVYIGATDITRDNYPENQSPWLHIINADLSDFGTYKDPENLERVLSQSNIEHTITTDIESLNISEY